jgi:hypothetical protein
MFTMSNSERYDLRSNNSKLVLAKPKTNSLKRTFRYAAAKVWNQMSVKQIVTVSFTLFGRGLLGGGGVRSQPNEKQPFDL